MSVAGLPADLAALYEMAFDASPTAVVVADRGGTIVAVSREVERQFGYAREELVGKPIEIIVPGSVAALQSADRESVAAKPAERAFQARRKDGSEFPVEIALNPTQTAKGSFAIASIVDMSERRRADVAGQTALEDQLTLERVIAELSSDFINIPGDGIDEAIRNGLGRACELLSVDRGTLVRIGPEGIVLSPICWSAAGVQPLDETSFTRERYPWMFEQALSGQVVCFSSRDEVPDEIDRVSAEEVGTQSAMVMPLLVDGHVAAVIKFSSVRTVHSWPLEKGHRFNMVASVFAQVVARQQRDEALQAAIEEAHQLKNQLHAENAYLRREARERLGPAEIVGRSAALRQVLAQAEQVASTDSTVLLLGETGTGKELFASHIHSLGVRRARQMVRVNCAAIPATLIESELFGREKGAFTGSLSRQAGRFELADHSTIFLDEIGDLPLDVQVKLLRVLEERKFERLGSPRSIPVDTRIIAATHRNLEQRIAEGKFREDLYYRLNVFPIHVPPLRDRVEDIPLLVQRLVDEFSRTFGRRIEEIERDTLAALQRYAWPGNIRELRNVVERAMIVATGKRLTIPLPESTSPSPARSPKLLDVERDHILAVLEASGWRIRGAGGAAARLGMKPTTLETRMAKLGLQRPAAS